MIDKTAIMVFALIIVLGAAAAIDTAVQEYVQSFGTIIAEGASLKLYVDSDLKQEATIINWGNLSKNTAETIYIYAFNNGSDPDPLHLELDADNWQPLEAVSYLRLSWNATNTQLSKTNKKCLAITLTVLENASYIDFSFNIIIRGIAG